MLSGTPRLLTFKERDDFGGSVISEFRHCHRLGRLDVKAPIIQDQRTNDVRKPSVRGRETNREILLDPSHDLVDRCANRVLPLPRQIESFQCRNRRPKVGHQNARPVGVIDASSSALGEVNSNRTRIPHPDADHLTNIISLPARTSSGLANEAAISHVRKRIIHPAVRTWIFQVLVACIQVLQSTRFSIYSEHRCVCRKTSVSHSEMFLQLRVADEKAS